jgi:hypothetical protein
LRLRRIFRIRACTVTSSAVVGSSASKRSGLGHQSHCESSPFVAYHLKIREG